MRGAVAACAALLFLSTPAHALVAVVGPVLRMTATSVAKAGIDPGAAVATCTRRWRKRRSMPAPAPAPMSIAAVIKVALGRIDDAMADYNRGLSMKPELGDGYVDRGAALIALKRYDEAMDDINKGIGLGQTYEQIGYYNRGVAEFYMGKTSESYHDFKKALEIAPEFALAREQLKNFIVTRVPAGQGRTAQ